MIVVNNNRDCEENYGTDIMSTDHLSCIKDSELESRLLRLSDERKTLDNQGYDVRLWDIELAYAIREHEHRQKASILRNEYVNSLRREEQLFQQQEASLQYFDFDNFKQPKDHRDE